MSQLRLVLFLNFLAVASVMAILPVIGPIIREMGLNEWHSGLIVSISGIFWMLFAKFWGTKSDQFGRRSILLITTAGFMASYFTLSVFIDMALSAAWSIVFLLLIFILLRALIGAFYGGIPSVCAAYIADVTTKENRTSGMALLGASTGLAMVMGPFLAGILAKQGLVLPLYVASLVPILSIFVILLFVPKNTKSTDSGFKTNSKKKPVKFLDKRLRLPVIAALFAFSSVNTAQIVIGFYILDILHLPAKMTAQMSGYAMGIVGIALIFIQIIISKLPRIAPLFWLILGSFVAAIGFLLVIILQTQAGLLIGYAISALGLGAVFPALQTIASHSVSENEQGGAAGSVAAAQGLAMVLAPLIGTLVYEINPLLPYALSSVALLLLWLYAVKFSFSAREAKNS